MLRLTAVRAPSAPAAAARPLSTYTPVERKKLGGMDALKQSEFMAWGGRGRWWGAGAGTPAGRVGAFRPPMGPPGRPVAAP